MNKKMLKKQIVLFVVICFAISWISLLLYCLAGGEYDTPFMNLLIACEMLVPTIAVLIVRKVTKEGFAISGEDSLQLTMNFKNKKWIWYLFAFLAPSIYNELGCLLVIVLFPETYYPEALDLIGLPENALFLVVVSGWTTALTASIGTLGEEIGWRTYLYPKLEKVWGPIASVLVGGIIWGVWHFPANSMGHNFGTDYWGEPWSGYLSFTLSCIAMGAMLYLVTKKTGSVWPAAFLHAVSNSGNSVLKLCCDASKLPGLLAQPPVMMLLTGIPTLIMGAIALFMICKMKSGENEVKE